MRTQSQFKGYYDCIKLRSGVKRAIVAVAHKLVRTLFRCLKSGKPYIDPTIDYTYELVSRNKSRWIRQLRKYGFVKINEKAKVVVLPT